MTIQKAKEKRSWIDVNEGRQWGNSLLADAEIEKLDWLLAVADGAAVLCEDMLSFLGEHARVNVFCRCETCKMRQRIKVAIEMMKGEP